MRALAIIAVMGLTACDIKADRSEALYSSPSASGLNAVRAYPGPNDICQVIGENDLTAEYLDHTAILVGCPVHETGAISDRIAEGGKQVDQVGDWVLLSVPN